MNNAHCTVVEQEHHVLNKVVWSWLALNKSVVLPLHCGQPAPQASTSVAAWLCITLSTSLWTSEFGVASHHPKKIPLFIGKERDCMKTITHKDFISTSVGIMGN